MMQAMAEVSSQVQLATQQQRNSTDEVVGAVEHIAEGSRSVSNTAREIASPAQSQGALAADLAHRVGKPEHPRRRPNQRRGDTRDQ